MKHTVRLMLVASLTTVLFSCKKENHEQKAGTFYGPSLTLGTGNARSFVTIDATGKTEEIGVAISEDALNSLPSDHQMLEMNLELPAQALANTPFKFVGLDYNPHGHEPNGVYTVPHFDFHFYKITNAERLTIALGDPKLDILPAPAYLPANFFAAGGVPQMGNHWIDPLAPELNGQPFTTTFLYGSYNGKVIFMEPMITVDFIKATQHQHMEVKQASKFSPAGNYPTTYCIFHNVEKKQYEITLEDFEARTAD